MATTRSMRSLIVLGTGLIVAAANAGLSTAFHLSIKAESTAGTDTKQWFMWQTGPDTWEYVTSSPSDFVDPGNLNVVASLNGDLNQVPAADRASHSSTTGIFVQQDPVVNLNFNVVAGAADTTFTVDSVLLSFASIASPVGTASASISATDLNATGVTVTPLEDVTGNLYRAAYNGHAAVLAGTTFASFFSTPLSAGLFGTVNPTQSVGATAIGVPVTDMSSRIKFKLTAGDIASGTTAYTLIPEPATLTLLAFGLFLVRRR